MKKRTLFPFLFLLLPLTAKTQQWQHIPGPDGGGIENFDTDGHTLYALTRAGIYRSEDEGYQWDILKSSLLTTRDKRQLRVENGIFYAFDKDTSLVRSTDGGASWKTLLKKPSALLPQSEELQVIFAKGDTLLIGGNSNIYRSTNRGDSWQATIQLTNELHDQFISIFEYRNEFFAAEGAFIHRSSDRGRTWKIVHVANIHNYDLVTATDSFVVARQNWHMVRSTDGFRTWQEMPTDSIGLYDYFHDFNWLFGWGNDLFYFYRGSHPCNLWYFHSTDGGLSWHGRYSELTDKLLMTKMTDGVLFDRHIVVAGDGIFHSPDSAKTFDLKQQGLPVMNAEHIISREGKLSVQVGSSSYLSEDQGNTWLEHLGPLPYWTCLDRYRFAATQKRLLRYDTDTNADEIEISDDLGRNWKTIDVDRRFKPAVTDHAIWLLYSDQMYVQNVLQYSYKVFKLQDGDTSLVLQAMSGYQPQSRVQGFYGFGDRIILSDDDQYTVFDDTGNFIRIFPLTPCSPSDYPLRFYFDGSTYYALCANHTFIFTAGSGAWKEIYLQDWTTGIPFHFNPITFFVAHKGVLWAGLEGKGLFYATDRTGRFYPAQPQLPYPYPTTIVFDDQHLMVGTDGGGIYTMPLPNTEPDPAQKATFKIFPNPSPGNLQLTSDLFFMEEINLSVLDATGRLLAEKVLAPGQYWLADYSFLPAGLYLLQLRTPLGVFGVKWVRQ